MAPMITADYTEMWNELGLDLEAHGVLVRMLPESYREVYLTQKQRPEGMRYFDFMLNELHGRRVKELVDLRRAGGTVVGLFCPAVPEELVFAFDSTPIGLCAGVEWMSEDAAQVLPQGTCSLTKSLAALSVDNVCPHIQTTSLIVGETTCAARKEVYELLGKTTDMHMMELPCADSDGWREQWRIELHRLIEKLEQVTGISLTEERLRTGVRIMNDKRRALRRFSAVRSSAHIPISGRDALLVYQFALYDDVDRYTRMVNAIADELETRVELRLGISGDAARVLVTGAPMPVPNWKVHHIIERSGGIVVGEEMCTGSRYYDRLVDESAPTMDALLEDIIDKHVDLDCACTTAYTQRADGSVAKAKALNAHGIVHHVLEGCQSFSGESEWLERAAAKAGLGFLALRTDYSRSDADAISDSIAEFLAGLPN